MKASPGRGKLSPQVTDEGAGQQHFALNTPHPALRATFPQGVKALALGQASKIDFSVGAQCRIDERLKKRYTISRRCSSAAGCRGVAQLVARLLWEQEAASSSLATPIMQLHVDSLRIGVPFCFIGEIDERFLKVCKKCATTPQRFIASP